MYSLTDPVRSIPPLSRETLLRVFESSNDRLVDTARVTLHETQTRWGELLQEQSDQHAVAAFWHTLNELAAYHEPTDLETSRPYEPAIPPLIEETNNKERPMDTVYSDTYLRTLQNAQANQNVITSLLSSVNYHDPVYQISWAPIVEILRNAVVGTDYPSPLNSLGWVRRDYPRNGNPVPGVELPRTVNLGERLWICLCVLMYSGRPIETSCIAMLSSLAYTQARALLWKFGASDQEVRWVSELLAHELGGPQQSRTFGQSLEATRLATLLGAPYKANRPNPSQYPYAYPYKQTLVLPTFIDNYGRVYALHGGRESEASEGHIEETIWQEGAEVWLVCWPVPRTSGSYQDSLPPEWNEVQEHPQGRSAVPPRFDFIADEPERLFSPSWDGRVAALSAEVALSLPFTRDDLAVELANIESDESADDIRTTYRDILEQHVSSFPDPLAIHNIVSDPTRRRVSKQLYSALEETPYLEDRVDLDANARRREFSTPAWRCSIPSFPEIAETLWLAQNRFMWRYDQGAEVVSVVVTQVRKTTRPARDSRMGDQCALCCVRIVKLK